MNISMALLAFRYLMGTSQERSVSVMVKICFLGIFIGSSSLALVMAVMNGFEKATHEKMQGIHAQLMIKSPGNALDTAAIEPILQQEFKEVTGYSPQYISQALLSSDGNSDLSHVVMIKGIEPEKEARTSAIYSKIIAPKTGTQLSEIIKGNKILIGSQIAEQLHIGIGNKIYLIYVNNQSEQDSSMNMEKKTAVIGGIFKTGIEEFDSGLIFSSTDLFKTMFNPQGADQITLKLAPNADEAMIIKRLKNRLGLEIYSWKDLYPALVSALKLEKYVMFFILALITLVACMNMVSLLFMLIIQKRGDIAILKTMGMKTSHIKAIFVSMSLLIATVASLAGLVTAWLVALVIKHYPLITLPDVYYVTHLPISLDIHIFMLIFFAIILMSLVAAWLPVRKINTIQIADVLRFDA